MDDGRRLRWSIVCRVVPLKFLAEDGGSWWARALVRSRCWGRKEVESCIEDMLHRLC